MHTDAYADQKEELLESIHHDEEELLEAVHELTGAARFKFDLNEHIRASPVVWVVGGFLVGFWCGFRPRRGVSLTDAR